MHVLRFLQAKSGEKLAPLWRRNRRTHWPRSWTTWLGLFRNKLKLSGIIWIHCQEFSGSWLLLSSFFYCSLTSFISTKLCHFPHRYSASFLQMNWCRQKSLIF